VISRATGGGFACSLRTPEVGPAGVRAAWTRLARRRRGGGVPGPGRASRWWARRSWPRHRRRRPWARRAQGCHLSLGAAC